MDIRKVASLGAIALGVLMIIGGIATWTLVTSELSAQNITVSEDACLEGEQVNGPFTAWCQADIIEQHALEATDGQTYAELDREDPLRDTAMNASFLRASLYTSIVSYGLSAMAIAMGVVFILIGLGMRDVEQRTAPREKVAVG